jgi:hypothetical protein
MTSPLFSVHVTVDGHPHGVNYDSITDAINDPGMYRMFDAGLITACTIRQGDKRIAGLPRMTWEHFKDAIVSNSTAILRRL